MLAGSQNGLLYASPMLGGDDGSEQIVRMIRSLVDDAWRDSGVNEFAAGIVLSANVPQYDALGQVRAIYEWVRQNYYFLNDPVSKQALRPVRAMLTAENKYGNCANINATLLPALLGSIGYETRLVTVATNPNDPENFSHVYCEALVDGQWIPLDAAWPGASFGVAPPQYYRRAWWSLTDSSHGDYDGVNGLSGRRGLNGITPTAVLSDLSSTLTSVSGQLVQPAIQNVIGPGGSTIVSQPAPVASNSTMEILLLLAAGVAIWWVMQ
jgi:hypothetical protein